MGSVRSGYADLIVHKHGPELGRWSSSWEELGGVLREFIWSEKAFNGPVGAFWREQVRRSPEEEKDDEQEQERGVVFQSIESFGAM